jgi:hypothetical protein
MKKNGDKKSGAKVKKQTIPRSMTKKQAIAEYEKLFGENPHPDTISMIGALALSEEDKQKSDKELTIEAIGAC